MYIRWYIILWMTTAALLAQAQTLQIGFGTDKPPYVFENEKRGLEFDIVVEAARRAGIQVVPFFAPTERIHLMQNRGELDGIATTNELSGPKAAFYSKPYIEYHNMAAALAARRLEIKNVQDLGRYSVSAFQRARKLLGPEYETMAANNPQYHEVANQVGRNLMLFAGRVDVIIGDRKVIEYFNQKIVGQVDVNQPLTWYPLFPATPYQMAFRQEEYRDRFNKGLDTLRKSGAYREIEKRYQITPP